MGSGFFEGAWGLAVVLGAVLMLARLISRSRLPRAIKSLALAALGLRVLGSFVYYAMFELTSYGGGDYRLYYNAGLEYANRIWRGDFRMFIDSAEWFGNTWTGSQFVCFPVGVIAAL